MSRPSALKPLDPDQAAAADPFIHASLSASAGTGKTQVLTARVLRLLLENASPESILCLTFTKAAAAEMAERVGGRLAYWIGLDDAGLGAELVALGVTPTGAMLARARQLFATVLDCPGGLRIQTIHSFCQTLLAAFPSEAGITPGFRPIEGREEEALVERTLAALAERSDAGDRAFLADLEILASRLGEADVRTYLRRCAGSVEGMARFDRLDAIEAELRDMMGLPEDGVEEVVAARCHDDEFDCSALQALADAYRRWGTKTAEAIIPEIDGWLALPAAERCRELQRFAQATVLTGSGSRRSVKNLVKHWPDAQEESDALCEKVEELLGLLRGDALVRLLAAGLRAGKRFADAYAAAKRAEGVADFDDLIRWSRNLLAQEGMGEWIRFKLDRRTDHLLVDEAQDTNESQWAIVKALTEEYWSGQGAGPEHRTLFMVGDFKQAIYGFQGTDPAEFERARAFFRDAAAGGAMPFRSLSISRSFRSAQAVLDVVDMVLGQLTHSRIGLPEEAPPHLSFHAGRAGSVEVWPPFEHVSPDDEGDGEEKWEDEARRRYASELADWIKAEIDRAPVLASTGRPLSPGDILVLVRSRANLAPLLVARLFERNVRTAGLDRLVLSEPLAVQDLLAAIRFAVQPLDDLNLANLLVSPLVGWSQEQLYELAGRERRRRLWEELGHRSGERPDFTFARETLADLLRVADFTGPHAFLERILSGPLDGRRKLLARLGRQARDPISELIAAAIQFEGGEPVTLQQFLAWLSHGKLEVKRDPEGRGDAVRIMTVHGAKGLEAPLVILADATANPSELGGNSAILDVPSESGRFPIIRPRKDEVAPPFDGVLAAEKARDLEEHFRLLYVALTRAGEKLVVAGLKTFRRISDDSWHSSVSAAMMAGGIEPDAIGILRHATGQQAVAATIGQPPAAAPVTVPAWARSAAPLEARPPRPLAPSQVTADTDSRPPPTPELAAAATRGCLLHALFERLPATPHEDRRRGALEWLKQSGGELDMAERARLVDAALGIIEAPDYAELFSPAALAEAPIAATLPDGMVVAGTVDRLLVTDAVVRVVDFKTGRQVPAGPDAIPAGHVRQMRAYGQALQVIFPRHRIDLALLYTEAPRMLAVQLEDLPALTHMG
ncbi:ATP-dependent helicase/nuclease subunit A [Sphingomonas kaistensis]|uniref:DNA 3'-5' helicase n=1 Tax=Sphingomonas kaistensis TaxID=298708 RepID=A0A7X5Y899_9SPHN|nr:double-strand break repair helicase AddA [Sphingomonas kaistensis]NJC06377.1 ATP-dependent helicase/nuclease subunit A [Sphingomonas kaistensis]